MAKDSNHQAGAAGKIRPSLQSPPTLLLWKKQSHVQRRDREPIARLKLDTVEIRSGGAVLEFDVNALNGEPIRVEVNDDGTGEWSVVECSLDNNRAVWEAIPCVADE